MSELALFNAEAEEIVLGSIFLEDKLIRELPNLPDHFSAKNKVIFKALQEMDHAGKPIEIAALMDHIGMNDLDTIGGLSYVMQIAGASPTTKNVRYYSQLLAEYYQKRQTIEVGARLSSGALTAHDGIQQLQDVDKVLSNGKRGDIKDGLKRLYQRILTPNSGYTGIRTYFTDLDRLTSGLQKKDLIIVAARPSVGKSAFANNIAINSARSALNPDGAVVIFFSLEMSEDLLLERMACSISRIDSQKIRTAGNGSLSAAEWEKLDESMDILYNSDIRIIDRSGLNLHEIRTISREIRNEFPDREIVIMIDYLQLIRSIPGQKFGTREQEVSEISRSLKELAKEMDAPVIALSQITRGVESRQDKRPMISDLRESGSLEQDADIVAFLYREDYYDAETEDKNMIEIIIAKQRNGPTGTVKLAYMKEISKFYNIDMSHYKYD